MSHVIACIDGSAAADSICDHAAWAAGRLNAPLMLLHVLDEARYPGTKSPSETNLSGNLGLGARETLLTELADLDAKRNRLALEQGKATLEAARARVAADGVPDPVLRSSCTRRRMHRLRQQRRVLHRAQPATDLVP